MPVRQRRAENCASDRERRQQDIRSSALLVEDFRVAVEHAQRVLVRPG
jgi:hypothetical protein